MSAIDTASPRSQPSHAARIRPRVASRLRPRRGAEQAEQPVGQRLGLGGDVVGRDDADHHAADDAGHAGADGGDRTEQLGRVADEGGEVVLELGGDVAGAIAGHGAQLDLGDPEQVRRIGDEPLRLVDEGRQEQRQAPGHEREAGDQPDERAERAWYAQRLEPVGAHRQRQADDDGQHRHQDERDQLLGHEPGDDEDGAHQDGAVDGALAARPPRRGRRIHGSAAVLSAPRSSSCSLMRPRLQARRAVRSPSRGA